MTDLRYFEFYPDNAKREWNGSRYFLRILFGPGEIKTTGGGGGWEDVKRPYLPPLTVWRGPAENLTHKIPFMLDAYSRDEDHVPTIVQQHKRQIEELAGVLLDEKKGVLPEPPTLVLDGYGTIPHDETSAPLKHVWIISEPPEWGEMIRDQEGKLLRQAGTLSFKRHEADISLERVNPPTKESTLFATGKQSYEEIAKNSLHNAHYGLKLARLNHAQKASDKPRHGLIRGPSPKELIAWKRGK